MVPLREGKGSRKEALGYLKSLIKGSEHSKDLKYAAEYMKLFEGKEFTQSEVIEAFERFGPWCINKRMSGVYDFDVDGRFALDREDDTGSYTDKLNNLIGLDIVKTQINNVIASDLVEKERMKHSGNEYQPMSSHMIFGGNPGSAKTTVAEIFAGIAREKGILSSGTFVVRGGMDLDGLCCVPAIREAFVAAKGGVLFIDEAYSLVDDRSGSFGDEAINTIVQEMENHREDVVVIFAGYPDEMEKLLQKNPGLRSRIAFHVPFADYNTEELCSIAQMMGNNKGVCFEDEALTKLTAAFDIARKQSDFGNGRYVRNLLEQAKMNQASRLLEYDFDAITVDEIKTIKAVDVVIPEVKTEEKCTIGFAY